jgi:hypothetical protein
MTKNQDLENGKSRSAEQIHAAEEHLKYELVFSPDTSALVVVACANPRNRTRPEEQALIQALHEAGIGTLRIDLFTQKEAAKVTHDGKFDVQLLAERVRRVGGRLRELGWTTEPSVGYYASGCAACAALRAARADDALRDALVICERGRGIDDADTACPVLPMAAVFAGSNPHRPSRVETRPDPELVKDLFRTWLGTSQHADHRCTPPASRRWRITSARGRRPSGALFGNYPPRAGEAERGNHKEHTSC